MTNNPWQIGFSKKILFSEYIIKIKTEGVTWRWQIMWDEIFFGKLEKIFVYFKKSDIFI